MAAGRCCQHANHGIDQLQRFQHSAHTDVTAGLFASCRTINVNIS